MILAIGHESGVGKDTFAMCLIDYLRSRNMKGLKILREGFADRLYDMCHSFYGWAGFKTRQHYLLHPAEKMKVLPLTGRTPRQMLIDISNKLNEFDPDMFMNAVTKNVDFHLKVIPDLRRPWEFDAVERVGGYNLRIKKPGFDSQIEMDIDLGREPYLSRWRQTIINDGDIKCLNTKAMAFAEEVVIPELQKSRIAPMDK